jgi:hypothetical protein
VQAEDEALIGRDHTPGLSGLRRFGYRTRKGEVATCLLQLLGAVLLIAVVLVHVAEEFRLVPWMGWGLPDSAGHYVDLVCALSGSTLLPLGYLLRWRSRRGASN